jgi:flagellin-specific chaperone FliS
LGKAVRRTIVEVRDYLHRKLLKLALLNDLRIYVLVNGVLEEFLGDWERVKALVKRLRVEAVSKSY